MEMYSNSRDNNWRWYEIQVIVNHFKLLCIMLCVLRITYICGSGFTCMRQYIYILLYFVKIKRFGKYGT